MFRTALLGAAVVVWQIYELTSAAEEPSRGVLTLYYVFLALGVIALVAHRLSERRMSQYFSIAER
jgi:hypothetical protein